MNPPRNMTLALKLLALVDLVPTLRVGTQPFAAPRLLSGTAVRWNSRSHVERGYEGAERGYEGAERGYEGAERGYEGAERGERGRGAWERGRGAWERRPTKIARSLGFVIVRPPFRIVCFCNADRRDTRFTVSRQATFQTQGSEGTNQSSVTVGITGHYRVGNWAAVRFDPSIAGRLDQNVSTIETTDGDGVRVGYDQPINAENDFRGYAIRAARRRR